MSATLSSPPPAAASPSNTPSSPDTPGELLVDILARTIPKCVSPIDGWQTALTLMVRHWDAPYSRITLDSTTGAYDESQGAKEAWGKICKGMQLKARLRQSPLAKLYHSSNLKQDFGVIAVPLRDADRRVSGAVTVVVACGNQEALRARTDEMAALMRLLHELIYRKSLAAADTGRVRSDLTRVAKAAEYNSVQEFAFTLTNTLKSKLDCEQVSLGMVHGHSVQLLCISGLDVLYPRAPGATVILQAMQECLDAGRITCFQAENVHGKGGGHTGHRLHRDWHEKSAHSCVASVPLYLHEKCVAILGLRRRPSEPFSPGELQKVVEMTGPLATGLLLLDRGQRSLLRHLADTVTHEFPRWFGRQGRGRRIALMAGLAFASWFIFAKKDYEVSLACTLLPSEQRTLSAPFEGVIAERHVAPGDAVRAGQLLVAMDTRELQVRRAELQATREMAAVERSHATRQGDMAAAAQAQARWKVAEAKLAAVEWRIQQAQVQSPSDGIILDGELTHRIGQVVPLGEPLLEFSDGRHWQVELEIPEHLAPLLQVGQFGTFAPVARPDEVTACQVQSIHATAHRKHAANYYVARAIIAGNPPTYLRSGMEGVARVHVGRYPVWWVSLHRLLGAVQLQLWKW